VRDLIVIGAGLSGLALARRAAALGAETVVLEARARTGGRVLGHRTAAGTYDLGPAWVWPTIQPRIAALAASTRLTLTEQWETGGFVFQDAVGGTQRLASGFPQEPPSMRVVGGITALVDALSSGLPPGTLRLRHTARRVTLGESCVTVTADTPDGPSTLDAARVALALPPRLIGRIEIHPALPESVAAQFASIPGWMAGQAKALALYDRPFWRDAGLSGSAVSQAGPLGEIHDASLPGAAESALFGFFAWPATLRAARHADIETRVARQLGALFGGDAGRPREIIIQDWAREPFTAIEADRAPMAAHPEYRPLPLPAPWGKRLLLTGSELAPEFAGYLEGALAAADAANLA
jgi:monoamine oxidase